MKKSSRVMKNVRILLSFFQNKFIFVLLDIENNSLVNQHRSTSNSVKYRQSQNQSQDRTSVSHNHPTHSPSVPPSEFPRNVSVIDSDSRGLLTKLLNLFVSSLNILLQIIPSLIHHARTLPLKTTVCIVLFLILLFFHAFYLMKVANRIENRLQSLHHLWPSSSNGKEF